ncbi:MAG: beta-galactosidase [Lachnospiraceae bacterium]|nr:beta-galactosidase [Lachnospiraceae bacterium]
MSRLQYDTDGFLLDGKRFRILSGTINYFRVLPEYWEDRLLKLKKCGMNTLETYTCWNLHERREGEFDFSGILDLPEYLETAARLGLFVILRPGPYVCGEWDKGGLPSWLENVPGMRLRCFNEPFISKVRAYYEILFEKVRPYLAENGGPVIMLQAENEYGSFGDDRRYMEEIKKIYEDLGIRELIFTSDGPGWFMLSGGALPDTLATVNFGSNPKDNFALLKKFRPESPLMCTEYWNGWFDHWGEEHHKRDSADTADVLKEMLSMNANVNMYMFHGGTNFGFNNGANYDKVFQPTVTSYDYNCPVSECGDLTEKYKAVKKVVQEFWKENPELFETYNEASKKLMKRFGEVEGENSKEPADLTKKAYGKAVFTGWARLFDNLENLTAAKGFETEPLKMEEMGADFGYMVYESDFTGPFENLDLTVEDVKDRAHVFKDGTFLGLKDDMGLRDDKMTLGLKNGEKAHMTILLENMGRVNYGGHIRDKKGIGGVRIANRYHYGWLSRHIPIDDPKKAEFKDIKCYNTSEFSPLLLKGEIQVDTVSDTFVKTPGFHKGCIFVNGFNIGRYWNDAGPQKTLYVPAPLLKEGRNEIIIFETDGLDENAAAEFTDKEDLG